jgi:hypothetical protein
MPLANAALSTLGDDAGEMKEDSARLVQGVLTFQFLQEHWLCQVRGFP